MRYLKVESRLIEENYYAKKAEPSKVLEYQYRFWLKKMRRWAKLHSLSLNQAISVLYYDCPLDEGEVTMRYLLSISMGYEFSLIYQKARGLR